MFLPLWYQMGNVATLFFHLMATIERPDLILDRIRTSLVEIPDLILDSLG